MNDPYSILLHLFNKDEKWEGERDLSLSNQKLHPDDKTNDYHVLVEGCQTKSVQEQIGLFKCMFAFFQENSSRAEGFITFAGWKLPFLSRVIAYSTSCISMEQIFRCDYNEDEMKVSIEKYLQTDDSSNGGLISTLSLVLLYPFKQSLLKYQQSVIDLFSPPLSISIQKYLETFIQTGIYMKVDLSPFISHGLKNVFHYKMKNPMLPLLKEQLQQCEYKPLQEGEDLEIESLLSEKEIYRSYLKFFISLSSSQQSLFLEILPSTTLPQSFWFLIRDNNRKVLKIIEHDLVDDLRNGIHTTNLQENLLHFIETISHNDFEGLIHILLNSNQPFEDKECELINTIILCLQQSKHKTQLTSKCRFFSTIIKNSIITFNKSKHLSQLIQAVNQLNLLLTDETPINKDFPPSEQIRTTFVPDQSIIHVLETMMKEVHFLNKNNSGNELCKLPKTVKEQVLFRKNWFRINIVESVLRMQKTKDLREFELALYQNALITEKEHSDYLNNVPFKPKETKTAEERKRIQEELPAKNDKQPRVDAFNQRLERSLSEVSLHLSDEIYHQTLMRLKNLILEREDITHDNRNSIFKCFFIEVENVYFQARHRFFPIVHEWLETLALLPEVPSMEIVESREYEETIGQFVGCLSCYIYHLNTEEVKETWSGKINELFDQVLKIINTNTMLGVSLIQACFFLLQVFDGRMINRGDYNDECVIIHSTLYPTQFLTSLSLMQSLYSIPSLFYVSTIQYSYQSAHSLSHLRQIVHSLLNVSTSSSFAGIPITKQIQWSESWLVLMRETVPSQQVLQVLIAELNSFTKKYPEFCILLDMITNDNWTDMVSESWNNLFVFYPQEQVSAVPKLSFTLSSSSSPSPSMHSCSIGTSLITLLSELLLSRGNEIESISMIIHFIKQQTEEFQTFDSFHGYGLFLVILCKLVNHSHPLMTSVTVKELFELVSTLAPLKTVPSSLLSGLLFPIFQYFIDKKDYQLWSSLSVEEQVAMIQCLPCFIQQHPFLSKKEIDNSAFLWNSYHTVHYWYSFYSTLPVELPDNPFFLLSLFLSSFAAYFPSCDNRGLLIDHIRQTGLSSTLLWFILHHLMRMEGKEFTNWFDIAMLLIGQEPVLLQSVLDGTHNCLIGPSVVYLLSSSSNELLSIILSNEERKHSYVDCVLCLYQHCQKRREMNRCLCEECRSGQVEEKDLQILRETLLLPQDKILSSLYAIYPGKSIHHQSFYSQLQQCFSVLCIVSLTNTPSILIFILCIL